MQKRSPFGIVMYVLVIAGLILLVHLHARLAYALFLPSVSYQSAQYEFWDSFWTYTSDPAVAVPTHFLGLMLLCITLAILVLGLPIAVKLKRSRAK